MFRIFASRISSCGSVVRALRLISVRLPIQIQPVCFCPSGVSAPALFKSSEAKPAPSSHHGWPASDRQLLLVQELQGQHYSVQKWYAEKVEFSPVKLKWSHLFILVHSSWPAPSHGGPAGHFSGFVNGQCFNRKLIVIKLFLASILAKRIGSILILGNIFDMTLDVLCVPLAT